MAHQASRQQHTIAESLARRVERRRGSAARRVEALRELGAVDQAVYTAVADTPTAVLDGPVRRLSNAANRSHLWLGIAAVIAVLGGRRGRRAALEGVVAIGVTSATVNLGLKPLANRQRPNRHDPDLPPARSVPMPKSSSFPSGHAASAFAFTYAVGQQLPGLAVPMGLLAGGVAYSRVHTGVHYPGDVIVGSILGAGTATMVVAAGNRLLDPSKRQS